MGRTSAIATLHWAMNWQSSAVPWRTDPSRDLSAIAPLQGMFDELKTTCVPLPCMSTACRKPSGVSRLPHYKSSAHICNVIAMHGRAGLRSLGHLECSHPSRAGACCGRQSSQVVGGRRRQTITEKSVRSPRRAQPRDPKVCRAAETAQGGAVCLRRLCIGGGFRA